jgi:hypothetical protein
LERLGSLEEPATVFEVGRAWDPNFSITYGIAAAVRFSQSALGFRRGSKPVERRTGAWRWLAVEPAALARAPRSGSPSCVGPPPTPGRDTQRSMLLTEEQVAEIRAGVRDGIRGPVMLKWVEQLLADRDERVRLEAQRNIEGRRRERPGADRRRP